jgi:hypothetical protein
VEEVFDLIREDINLWRAAGRVIAVWVHVFVLFPPALLWASSL